MYTTNYESFGTDGQVVGGGKAVSLAFGPRRARPRVSPPDHTTVHRLVLHGRAEAGCAPQLPLRTVFLANGADARCFSGGEALGTPCSTEEGQVPCELPRCPSR